MSPAAADNAALAFTVALTVLLAASVSAVIRQPPWIPGPPAGEGPHHPDDHGRGPAGDGRHHAAQPPAVPGRAPDAPVPPGRHAAGTHAGPAPAPLPVRSPGQSGWTAPASADLAAGRPDGGWLPEVSGGPPWDPAPRPPGAS